MEEILVPIEPPSCRICQLPSPEFRGLVALRTLNILCPEISPSAVVKEHQGDGLIHLGCSCRGDMALAHYSCALRWFVCRSSTLCEVCHEVATNVRQDDVEKISNLISSYRNGSWEPSFVSRVPDVSLGCTSVQRESTEAIELTTIPVTTCNPPQDASPGNNSDASCSGAHEFEMEPMSGEAVNDISSKHEGEEDSAHLKLTDEDMEKRISDYVSAMNWFDVGQEDAIWGLISGGISPGHISGSERVYRDDLCLQLTFYAFLSCLSFVFCYLGPICLAAFILAVSFGKEITNYGVNYILGWSLVTLLIALIFWRSCANVR